MDTMSDEIINKVAASGLITINLEEIYPEGIRYMVDIAPQLWQGIALREKDFREWIKNYDWEQYREGYVAVFCSVDAIIPHWAYMLVMSSLTGVARLAIVGTPRELESALFRQVVMTLQPEDFRDARVVIKGCSDREVPVSAYSDLVSHLQPVVRSLMFGEPCSTVPVFKRKG